MSNNETIVRTAGLGSRIVDLYREHRNLANYALIGGSAVVVDLGLFILLHDVGGAGVVAAQSISVGVAVVWSFLLNAFFNFGTTDRLLARFLSFSAVSFIGYLVGLAIIVIAVEGFGIAGTIGKVLSMPVVFVTQYLLNSRFSFRSAT